MKHYSDIALIEFTCGELSETKKKEILKHLEVCDKCRDIVNEYQSLESQLQDFGPFVPAADTLKQIRYQIYLGGEQYKEKKISLVPVALLTAFFGILILGLYSIYFLPGSSAEIYLLQILHPFVDLKIKTAGVAVILYILVGSFFAMAIASLQIIDMHQHKRGRLVGKQN